MKIILARCASPWNHAADERYIALDEELRAAKHRTDLLVIPPLGDGFEALMAAASHRLMNLRSFCGALICLDRIACLLQHDRKFAFLPDEDLQSASTHVSAKAEYLSNLIEGGIREAERVKVPRLGKAKRQPNSNTLFDVTLLLRKLE